MPKSRGRRPRNGGKKPVRRAPGPVRLSDRMMRDAMRITDWTDPLRAETWASGWLGQAWLDAGMDARDAEHLLCLEVTGRACTKPSPHGLAAVAALARVAPADDVTMLTGTVGILAETQPLPGWYSATDPGWTPVAAWRASDVWDGERILLIDFDGPHPHTLMAQTHRVGGLLTGKLAVLEPGAASRWDVIRADEEMPMPITQQPVADVLTELADALETTSMTWPRQDDEDFVDNRALAWSRCRDYRIDWSKVDWDTPGLSGNERTRLTGEFVTTTGRDDAVSRSLAGLFLDFGDGYFRSGPLCWSPDGVMLFLTDWLPRKASLDDRQRKALPDVLRQWIAFALTQRGVDERWITPVVQAVDDHLAVFRDAFDEDSWGPARQIAADLAYRGVDLADKDAVNNALREINAERLARSLKSGDEQ